MHEDDHVTHDWTTEADQAQEAHHSLERAIEAVLTVASPTPGLWETPLGPALIKLKYRYRFWRHHEARMAQAMDRWLAQGETETSPMNAVPNRRVGRARTPEPPKMPAAQIAEEAQALFGDTPDLAPGLDATAEAQIPLSPGGVQRKRIRHSRREFVQCRACGYRWQPVGPARQRPKRCANPVCRTMAWQVLQALTRSHPNRRTNRVRTLFTLVRS